VRDGDRDRQSGHPETEPANSVIETIAGVSASLYFSAAAITLLLGTLAIPTAVGIYDLATFGGQDPRSIVMGVWAGVVLLVAIGAPIFLTAAGIVTLARKKRDGG